MKENNVELIPLPLSHSHALRTFYANMLKNGTVVITNGVANIKVIYNLIKKYSVTALDLSPSAALIMLKLSRGKFSEFNEKLDYIEIGTAVLPENTKVELRKQFPNVRLYNCYGSTESGRSCTLNFNSSDDEQYCIGRPSVNAEFIVVDDEKKVVESSLEKTGLIACKGRMNMKGYWRQPELTKETLENGYIYTSDEGYISEDGRIFLLGRKGDVINYKGIKIAPDEIEEVVKKFGNVIIDCSVVPQCDEAAGQIPVLVLSLKYELDMVDFKKFLVSNIDANKMPRKIVRFDEIPRTYNGKLQRGRLVKMMEEQPERIAILG
jgi:acyl-CoA synthetase (AMP-forming)/AMP-acid ligase II